LNDPLQRIANLLHQQKPIVEKIKISPWYTSPPCLVDTDAEEGDENPLDCQSDCQDKLRNITERDIAAAHNFLQNNGVVIARPSDAE